MLGVVTCLANPIPDPTLVNALYPAPSMINGPYPAPNLALPGPAVPPMPGPMDGGRGEFFNHGPMYSQMYYSRLWHSGRQATR